MPEVEMPSLKSRSRIKIMSAEPKELEGLPVIKSKVSFLPFINYLKSKAEGINNSSSKFYKDLIEKFEQHPQLLQPIIDERILEEHADLLEMLCNSLFPMVTEQEKNTYALAAPYQFRVFYYSDAFKKLFLDDTRQNLLLPEGLPSEKLKAIECSMIYDHVLEKFYGIKLNEVPALIYPVMDAATGMKRYYKIKYDRRFIDLHAKGDLPAIKDCAVCLNTFRIMDIDQQLKAMPLELFEAEGFALWTAEDVTIAESIESIKRVLLRHDDCDTSIINDLKDAVHAVVGLSDVEVGIMPFVKINGEFILDDKCTAHGLLGQQWKANDPDHLMEFRMFMGMLAERPGVMPLTVITEELAEMAPPLKALRNRGYRSVINYPLQNSDGLLGIVELASKTEGLLTHDVLARLEPLIPLLSVAMIKNRETFNNKIEKLVKEKFTALQPSVEWKFSEVAWDHLKQDGNDGSEAHIAFDNVYPLYGAIDIRNSSIERAHAMQKDLKQHLQLVNDTLDTLLADVQLTLLEELKYKNQKFADSISETLLTEDELKINEFLEEDVRPVLTHIQKSNSSMEAVIEHYFKVVNDRNGQLYHHRNEFEETLATINKEVLQYLEKEEHALQQSFPHYFEKYRTDGVEYNIYIGQSMAPNKPFDMLYLKNIRLWQLKSMAEVARITNGLLPSLKVPLQTTQIILVHNQPICISFRKDERRFDVEGSYNIRYEIMKKRIDKACIKETGERLTQPGKIAIVYGNQKEAQDYEEYIHFIQSKGLIQPGIEHLELEELQGLKGLKALRVSINMFSS
jgi:hypothetical protein